MSDLTERQLNDIVAEMRKQPQDSILVPAKTYSLIRPFRLMIKLAKAAINLYEEKLKK